MSAPVGLAAAAALHLGFQATITALVYPALSRVPADRWVAEHARHSRAITPLVGVVYGLLLAACVWALAADRSPASYVGVGGALLTFALTGALAAPLHGRLGERDDALVRRLLVVDRCRLAAAVLCAVGSLAAALSG